MNDIKNEKNVKPKLSSEEEFKQMEAYKIIHP